MIGVNYRSYIHLKRIECRRTNISSLSTFLEGRAEYLKELVNLKTLDEIVYEEL